MKFHLILASAAALAGAASTGSSGSSDCKTFIDWAKTGTSELLEMYNSTNGLWGSDVANFNGWWNTANMINIVGLYAKNFPSSLKQLDEKVLANTFYKAQEYSLTIKNDTEGLEKLHNTHPTPAIPGAFTRDYFDDDGWWAQAWIQAYDLTGNPQYLAAAEDIHTHIVSGWSDDVCNGGVYWSTAREYKNAIANELFLHVSALLAQRVKGKEDYYKDWAEKEYNWFLQSTMINANHTINDGLNNETCKNNQQQVWSYNQGVILGGLVELYNIDKNSDYLSLAKQIADGAIKQLSDNGVLVDPCGTDCWKNGDVPQFKGVFTRNLAVLYDKVRDNSYKDWLNGNAQSIWNNDRNSDNQFGYDWRGPVTPVTPQTHSSALDTLISTVDVNKCGSSSDGDVGDGWTKGHGHGWYWPTHGSHDEGWKWGGTNDFNNWPTFEPEKVNH